MKKLVITTSISLLCLLAGCGSNVVKIMASGKPYEIFVVTPLPTFKGVVGDSLRSVFNQEVQWVNQPEPIFDLFNVDPNNLANEVTRRHRNLLIVKVDPSTDSVAFGIRSDVWADGQIVVDLTAPSDSLAADYIGQNAKTITAYINHVEQQRMQARTKKYQEKSLTKLVDDKFHFTMPIPQGYRMAQDSPNFLWMTYEMPISSQGIFIYTFNRSNDEKLDILAQRNIAAKNIPGPVAASHMSTDTTFMPESTILEINGQNWVETRGFWRVEGDFMGGPFINYTTFDADSQRYIAIDMYVNSPSYRYPKRNYIRQLESIMLGVEIPRMAKASV